METARPSIIENMTERMSERNQGPVHRRLERTDVEDTPPEFSLDRFYFGDDGRHSVLMYGKTGLAGEETWGILLIDHLTWSSPTDGIVEPMGDDPASNRVSHLRGFLTDSGFGLDAAFWMTCSMLREEEPCVPPARLIVCHQYDEPGRLYTHMCWHPELRVRALQRLNDVQLVVAVDLVAGFGMSHLTRRFGFADLED